MSKIISDLRCELQQHVDLEYKKGSENFFKEPIECYGVRSPIVRKTASKFWSELKDRPKSEVFKLCEELFRSNLNEEAVVGTQWV